MTEFIRFENFIYLISSDLQEIVLANLFILRTGIPIFFILHCPLVLCV